MSNQPYPIWSVKYDPEKSPKIALETFRQGKSIAAVCNRLDIVKDTYYRWIEEHKEFGEACKRGLSESQEWWESKAQEAIFSTDKDLKFASSAYIFTMKCRFKENYSDQQQNDINVTLIEKLLANKE